MSRTPYSHAVDGAENHFQGPLRGDDMGETKYFVMDDQFYIKMRGAAQVLREQGAVIILQHTGMHSSSLVSLELSNLRKEGKHHYLYWRAPKPQRLMRNLRAPIPKADVDVVREWIKRYGAKDGKPRRKTRTIHRWIEEVGERAGFENVAPMTMRHQRIVTLMDKMNGNVRRVAALTGATYETIEKHYAQSDPALFEDDDLLEED